MSKTIDQKVVEMQFDNKSFEKNAAQSMSTIDNLKSKLDFSGASKAMQELDRSSKSVDMSPLGSAAEAVKTKFSALETIATGALLKIGAQAAQTGEQLVKSLTVDNLSEGWDKFGKKTEAVATLVSQGYELETVNEQMELLNWFTDETSYNFTAMAGEIGKFTASGQSLEDSVTAMMGIADWAALSGQNAAKASSAMYQLSQAMSKGALKYDDWKSIQNAGMDTREFRQNAIDSAIALGQVKKVGDDLYAIMTEVNGQAQEVGRYTLNEMFTSEAMSQKGWLDSEAMMSVFTKYGQAVKSLRVITDNEIDGIATASEAMSAVEEKAEEMVKAANEAGEELSMDDALRKASLEMIGSVDSIKEEAEEYIKTMAETEGRSLDFNEALIELGYGFDSFALKALRSAQEAKTWSDVIDATKDAVSTGWMNSFELIFGDYAEAKTLWTNLANEFYDIFASGGESRNDLLKGWKELGGRDLLFAYDDSGDAEKLGALWNILYSIKEVIGSVKDAWTEIFGETTSETLIKITTSISNFAKSLRLSDDQLSSLKDAFKGVFAVVDILVTLFRSAFAAAMDVVRYIVGENAENTFNLAKSLGDILVKFRDWIKESDIFAKAFGAVATVIKFLVDIVRGFIDAIKSVTGQDTTGLDSFSERVGARFQTLSEIIGKVGERLKALGSVFKKIFDFLKPIFDAIGNTVKGIFEGIKDSLAEAGKDFNINSIGNIIEIGMSVGLLASIKKITKQINSFKSGLKESFNDFLGIGRILEGITSIFNDLGDTLKAFTANTQSKTLLTIAVSIAVLVGSLVILTSIDTNKLDTAIKSITTLFVELMASFTVVNKLSGKSKKTLSTSVALIAVATSVLILSKTMQRFSEFSWTDIFKSIAMLKMSLNTMVKSLNKIDTKGALKKAVSMILLSTSVLIIAKGLKSIAEMSGSEIGASLFALSRSMKILPKALNSIESKGAIKKALSMILLTTSLIILSEAMTKLGALSWEEIGKALAAMAISLKIIPAAINSINSKGSIKKVLSMILMCSSLLILGDALAKMGALSWEEIGKSLIAMGVALAELMLAFKVLERTKISIKNILLLILTCASMLILADALAKFGSMSWDEIAKGLVSMGVAIAEILAMLAVIDKVKVSVKKILSLILAATSLLILGEALKSFSVLSWDEIARSLVAMGVAIAELVAALAVMGTVKTSLKSVLSFTIIAIAMNILAASLVKLGSMSWEQLAISLIAMGVSFAAVIAAVTLMGKSGSSAERSVVLMAAMSGTLMSVASAFAMLAGIGWAGLLIGVASMVTVITALALGAKILGPMSGTLVRMSLSMVAFSGSMIAFSVSAAAFGLSLISIGMGLAAIGTGIAVIGSGLIALGPALGPLAEGLMAMMPVIGEIIKGAVMGGLQLLIDATPKFIEWLQILFFEVLDFLNESIQYLVVVVCDLILELLRELDKSLPEMVNIALDLIVQLLDSLIPRLPEILDKTFIILIQALDSLIDYVPDIVDRLITILIEVIYGIANRIGDVAEATVYLVGELISGVAYVIAGSIGAIIGGIVDGIAKAVADGLPQLGTKLSGFTENAQPFLDATSEIDEDNLKGAKMLAETILCVVGAELLSGISDFLSIFTGSTSKSFGEKIVAFGYSMADFAEATKGIDGTKVQTSANAAKALAEFANALPKEGGLWQSFFGEGNLTKFGTEIESFGPHFAAFAESVKGIDATAVTTSAKAAEALSEFASKLPKEGGLWQELMGQGNLKKFADDLKDFGPSLKEYANSVKGLDSDVVVNSANAAGALSNVANGLKNHGGILQEWTGDSSLTTFANELKAFAPSLVEYGDSIKDLDSKAVEKSASAAQLIVNLENGLKNHGGVAQWFTGDSSIKSFAEELPYLGTGLNEFVTNLGTSFNSPALSMVSAIINGIIKLCENMGKINIDGFNQFSEMFVSIPQLSVDEFVNQFDGASERIENVATGLIDKFTFAAASKKDSFLYTFETLVDSCVAGITNNEFKMADAGHAFMDALVNALVDKNKVVMTTFHNVVENGLHKVEIRKPEFEDMGKNLVEGFIDGIENGKDAVTANISEIAKVVLDKFREELDINSPSKEMYKIGDYAITGFINAFADSSNTVYNTSSMIGDNALDGIKDALSGAIMSFDDVDVQPTITPVVDLSNVNASAAAINEVFGPDSTIGVAGNINAIAGDISTNSTISVDNSDVVTELDRLRGDMRLMGEKLSNLQVMLDTGVLVGSLADPMDSALGSRAYRKKRG